MATKRPAAKAATKKVSAKASPKRINRVAFVLDASVSMSGLQNAVRQRLTALIKSISEATPSDQLALFSVFSFGAPEHFRTLALDASIDSVQIEGAAKAYAAVSPSTALCDAVASATRALHNAASGGLIGKDVSTLVYVITDGAENSSRDKHAIESTLRNVNDTFTFGFMVPDRTGETYLRNYGVPYGNIEVWNPNTVAGLDDAVQSMTASYSGYSTLRSAGQTTTNSLFRPNIENLGKATVSAKLNKVDGSVFFAQKDYRIDEFVEKMTGKPYVKGSAFYELTKSELVQDYKKVVLVDKNSGAKFGGSEARKLLGLHGSGRVSIGAHGGWHVFIQSTSLNRKIPNGTRVYVEGT